MAVPPNDADADHADDAAGEQDAGTARTPVRLDGTDDAALTVFQTAEWVPPAYRQAYLDGAASVLGSGSLVEP